MVKLDIPLRVRASSSSSQTRVGFFPVPVRQSVAPRARLDRFDPTDDCTDGFGSVARSLALPRRIVVVGFESRFIRFTIHESSIHTHTHTHTRTQGGFGWIWILFVECTSGFPPVRWCVPSLGFVLFGSGENIDRFGFGFGLNEDDDEEPNRTDGPTGG